MTTLKPNISPPKTDATDSLWIEWHKQLESEFGAKDAAYAFVKAWAVRGRAEANTSALRTYFKDKGIDISADTISGKVSDKISGVAGSLTSIFKVGGTIMLIVWIAIIVVVLLVFYKLFSNPQTVGVIAKAAI